MTGYLNAADVNNDGFTDIITSDSNASKAYVFFGGLDLKSKNASQADLVATNPATDYNFGSSIATGDLNNDGYIEIALGDQSYNSNQGAIFIFTPQHHSTSITINPINNTTDTTPSITGKATINGDGNIGGIQWSFESSKTGEWQNCTAIDGHFNSITEKFSCAINGSHLSYGRHNVYFRAFDENKIYSLTSEYKSTSFTISPSTIQTNIPSSQIDLSLPTATITPEPINNSLSNDNQPNTRGSENQSGKKIKTAIYIYGTILIISISFITHRIWKMRINAKSD